MDENGKPSPHVYPIRAEKLGGVFYTCNNPGDNGAEALLNLMLGQEIPPGGSWTRSSMTTTTTPSAAAMEA